MAEILERGAVGRPRWRWIRRSIYAAVALGTLIAAGFAIMHRVSPEIDCRSTGGKVSDGMAVLVCKREYETTREPLIGAYLADALRRTGDAQGASAIANELLGTPVRADALQVLGKIAAADERTDNALMLLEEARRLHRERGNHRELARDDIAVVGIHEERAQYGEALQILDEAISEARVAGDAVTEAYCHLTASRILADVGYFDASHQELDRAAPMVSSERDLAQLWYARGNLEQEVVRDPTGRSHHDAAIAAFERSLAFAQRAGLKSLLLFLHMNLAYSLAEVGRIREADDHLSQAGVFDTDKGYEVQRGQLAARIAYRSKNTSLASSLNSQVYSKIDDKDDQAAVCVMQARIALDANDLVAAELWANRGIENVEQVRSAQTVSELRPWVLASRRQPFEVLFTVYARAGRYEDALGVFDRWQGRTLLDEMARPSDDPSPTLSATAGRIQRLGRWLPVVSTAPLMTSDARAVTQNLAKIDLLALAVAEHKVWRLTANHGRIRIDELGTFEGLHNKLESFSTTPTDPRSADELGTLILPPDLVRKTTEPLYVVLDAPFAALPIVALRRGGQPLIAARPVLRTPRFPVVSACRPRPDGSGALVLADAAGDLPDARRESSLVATQLGTTPLVGAAATSTALFAARSEPIVHIAVHADVDSGGGVLKLHDREVSAAEISANKLGPARVVLSACSTARSWDPELASSLSTAFLAGGSDQVVATLRPVSDAGALALTRQFYDADGARNPIRALASIQAELAKGDNKEWPNFAVFGVCSPPS